MKLVLHTKLYLQFHRDRRASDGSSHNFPLSLHLFFPPLLFPSFKINVVPIHCPWPTCLKDLILFFQHLSGICKVNSSLLLLQPSPPVFSISLSPNNLHHIISVKNLRFFFFEAFSLTPTHGWVRLSQYLAHGGIVP